MQKGRTQEKTQKIHQEKIHAAKHLPLNQPNASHCAKESSCPSHRQNDVKQIKVPDSEQQT
jgi:hypothetical protein